MGKGEAVSALKNVALFEGLTTKELNEIYKAAKEVHFPAGKAIVQEGEAGAAFHLILEGSARVTSGGRTHAKLGPGDYFGEMALIDRQPRSATVVADTDVRTLSLVSWSFLPLLDHMPTVAKKMLLVMTARLRAAEKSHTH